MWENSTSNPMRSTQVQHNICFFLFHVVTILLPFLHVQSTTPLSLSQTTYHTELVRHLLPYLHEIFFILFNLISYLGILSVYVSVFVENC